MGDAINMYIQILGLKYQMWWNVLEKWYKTINYTIKPINKQKKCVDLPFLFNGGDTNL